MPNPTVTHPRSGETPPVIPSGTESTIKTRLCQQALAERWGLSPKTLERWRVLGIGPVYIRLPGKVVYLCLLSGLCGGEGLGIGRFAANRWGHLGGGAAGHLG